MSNIFKKVTSASMALLIVLSIVRPFAGVMAAYTTMEAANKLATLGVIVDNSSNPANYRLGDSITRGEMAKVTMKLSETEVADACAGKFSDLKATDWACKYAEAGLANGYFAANATFRPMDVVTKIEALKMVMKARGIEKSSNSDWKAAYVEAGVEAGVLEAAFTDYDAVALRGWIFQTAVNAVEGMDSEDDDLLGDLLGDLDDEDTDTDTTDDTTDTDTDTVVTGGTLQVSLSPETPAAAAIPAGVNGIPVAKFDLTAGDEDVTVTSVTVKRKGLSDEDTLTGLAAFTSEGRASKAKNDSLENDTEATLTLTNGLVVKAGETTTLVIVADVADSSAAANDEFSIELKEVLASASVETEGSLVGNTFRVGSVDAATLDVNTNGTVSNPKLGEEGVAVFKFELKGDSSEDIVVNSLTFRADSSDAEEDLANFKLMQGTTELAATAAMNGKYLTFTLADGYTVASSKTEKFTVTADVVAGADDVIAWYVDKNLDISAEDTKYGYGAAIDITDVDAAGDLGTFTVQAGELTLVDIDPSSDKIKEDKDDVVLAKMTVTNIAGKSLELQKFGILATLTNGTAFVDNGAGGGTANNAVEDGTEGLTLLKLFENFELVNEDTGSAYELELVGNVYQDTDLNITLPQGVTNFVLRADTQDAILNFDTAYVDFSLDASLAGTVDADATNGQFIAVETEDDTVVSDFTPSSLTWKRVKGTEAGATLTQSPLSDLKKVRGAKGVVGLQFEIEADDSSALTIDELKVKVLAGNDMDGDGTANNVDLDTDGDGTLNAADTDDDNDGTVDGSDATPTGPAAAVTADNKVIAQVTLYKGSVSEDNLLDRVSGSNLASGDATFDSFEVAIAADAKQTFVVTVDFVDGIDTTQNGTYKLSIDSQYISAEDEDSDDVVVTPVVLTSARDITITNFGTLTLTQDANNDDNEDTKVVLAGTNKTVFSIDVQATNEDVDVETVEFDVDDDLTKALVSASLYLGDTLIATNSNSDITAGTITFDSLTTLIVPQESKELKLMLNTATIGFEKVGETIPAVTVTAVRLTDAEGVDSGKAVTDATDAGITTSLATSIVPGIVTPGKIQTLSSSSSQAKVQLTANFGSNTVDASNSAPSVAVDTITFSAPGATGVPAADYVLYEDGKSGVQVVGKAAGSNIVFDFNDLNGDGTTGDAFANGTVSSSKTYVIVPTLTSGDTASLTLLKNGVQYDVTGVAGATNITTQMTEELDFGTRSID